MLDEIIARLLAGRNARPGKQVQLTEQEMRQLCLTARDIFMSQPNLLELEAPIKICGAFVVAHGYAVHSTIYQYSSDSMSALAANTWQLSR